MYDSHNHLTGHYNGNALDEQFYLNSIQSWVDGGTWAEEPSRDTTSVYYGDTSTSEVTVTANPSTLMWIPEAITRFASGPGDRGGINLPKCTMTVSSTGTFSKNSGKTHPESNQLGAGVGNLAGRFLVEISAKILKYNPRDKVGLHQTLTVTITQIEKDSILGWIIKETPVPVPPDDPYASRQYNAGNGDVGFVDAPGISPPGPNDAYILKQKFTSSVTINGKLGCSIDWELTSHVFGGTFNQVFRSGVSY